MFDKLVETGSVFDWITPLFTLIQDFRNRPSVGYNVPVDGGWSAYAISDLLRAHGIKLWGLTIFRVRSCFGCVLRRPNTPNTSWRKMAFSTAAD